MEITAGLRCPSFGASFDSGYQKAKYADISGYVSGSQVLFIPTRRLILIQDCFIK
jgi:hypothetical protein